jgi:NAD dependent epimerase/dehydratase family enzyme
MSTATIYAHRFDAPNDEETGRIGGDEPDVPAYWARSIAIARAWEAALDAAPTPRTRRVALRTAMVMSPDSGGVFDVLRRLCRLGLGGTLGGGRQFVSWIHGADFASALDFLIARNDLSGAVNLAAPGPLPQAEHMRTLRRALGVPVGLPATAWMARAGAVVLRTDAELVLKSRYVVPGRLLAAGFRFRFPTWAEAAADLANGASDGVPRSGHGARTTER